MMVIISATEWIALSLGFLSVLLGILSVAITIWLTNIKNRSRYVLLKSKIRSLYEIAENLKSYENADLEKKFNHLIEIERLKATLKNLAFDEKIFVQIEMKKIIKIKYDSYLETCSEISNLIREIRGVSKGNMNMPDNTSYGLTEVNRALKENLVCIDHFLKENNICGFDLFYKNTSQPYYCFQRNILRIINGLKFIEKSNLQFKIDKKIDKLKKRREKLINKTNIIVTLKKRRLKRIDKKISINSKKRFDNIWTNY
jgi:hypothetical protein